MTRLVPSKRTQTQMPKIEKFPKMYISTFLSQSDGTPSDEQRPMITLKDSRNLITAF